MIKVKISCYGTSVSQNGKNPMIQKFLPSRKNIWRGCEFYWNDNQVTEADYWVILGDINDEEESCFCPKENVLFFGAEPPSTIRYDKLTDFINQFYRVYLSCENAEHPRAYVSKPGLNWWVDAGHPIKTDDEFNEWQAEGFGYDDFKKIREYNKTKLMSVFCSNKTSSPGHRARYAFCKKLKRHFGDKIDWFGSGVNNLKDKWEGIAPYKYHIALENNNYPNYWTEKLADSFMAGAYPIYSGATNINDYFAKDSMTTIDIRYPRLAFAIIEKLIADDIYEKSKDKILQARDLVMDKYGFFNMIAEIAILDAGIHNNKQNITLKNWQYFVDKNHDYKNSKKRSFIARISRSIVRKLIKLKLTIIDYFLLIKFKFFY